MIFLKNPGEIEIEAIKTMGVNVKEGENCIGYFGTGLKYAIAVFLREGISFSLYIGENLYSFHTEEKEIRGKVFSLCKMQSAYDVLDLGFTTELGKNWEVWQAYREIHSNTLDERGNISSDPLKPGRGTTLFVINLDDGVMDTFLSSQNKKLLSSDKNAEIYDGESNYIYYNGIRALEINKPSLYTYNVISCCELTEDRSLQYSFQVERAITNAIAAATCKKLIGDVITADNSFYESSIDACWDTNEPQGNFKEAAKENINSISDNFHSFFKKHEPKPELTKDQKKDLFLEQLKDICYENNMNIEIWDKSVEISGYLFDEG